MQIKLSEHFTVGKLIRFTLPTMAMMIFTSIYSVVDGFFVSNYAGKTAFTAVNLIYPYLMILGTFGFMFGAGGSALVAKTMGEGKKEKANEIFSIIVAVSVASSVVFALLGCVFLKPMAEIFGAEGQLLQDCVTYGRIILMAMPFFTLQMEFQSFFVTAEKPNLGLFATVISGVTNIALDAVLVGMLSLGIWGAAAATAFSQGVGGLIPIVYFLRQNTSLLKLTKFRFDGNALLKACTNGASELMSNISLSFVSMLYNYQLLRLAGEDGVAAFGVMMYVSMVFMGIFIGYSVGSAPIVGFHYGAGNHEELKGLFRKSLGIIGIGSVGMLILAVFLSDPLSGIYVGYDAGLLEMTKHGFRIFAWSFLFCGFGMYGSGFFTALNDGATSAIISFLRTFVFQVASVVLLPMIWKLDGIWGALVVSELMAALVAGIFFAAKKKQFHY